MRRASTLLALLAGCQAEIGVPLSPAAPRPSPSVSPTASPSPSITPSPCVPGAIAQTPLIRLNRAELDHVVSDLLGVQFRPSSVLSADEKIGAFSVNSGTLMSRGLAEQLQYVAEQIGDEVEADALRIAPCAEARAQSSTCAASFLDHFGPRALRRPLARDERARWLALYEKSAQDGGYAAGIRMIVEAMLQTPSFLYRFEAIPPGAAPGDTAAWRLDPFSFATRLSFFLWSSGPDDALLDAAASGRLDTSAGLREEVDRLLADPRALRGLDAFADAWADLASLDVAATSTTGTRGLTPETLALMRAETTRFFRAVLLDGDGRFRTLLTAPWSVGDPALLREIYGVTAAPGPDGRVPLDPSARAGVLSQAAVLFAHSHSEQSSPVLRGKWVREVLLCQPMQAPPPTVNAVPPPPRPDQTTRERFIAHRTDPSCAGCHARMDDIGFGFEAFDQQGRIRTMEAGRPVLTTGALVATDVNGPFEGVPALAEKLAGSTMARDCFATEWLIYSLSRSNAAGEQCLVKELSSAVAVEGGFKAMVHALVSSDSFRQRRSP